MGLVCSAYGGREEVYTGFWWGNLRERSRLGDKGVDGKVILMKMDLQEDKITLGWIFKKWDVGTWAGSIWFRIGTDGRHL